MEFGFYWLLSFGYCTFALYNHRVWQWQIHIKLILICSTVLLAPPTSTNKPFKNSSPLKGSPICRRSAGRRERTQACGIATMYVSCCVPTQTKQNGLSRTAQYSSVKLHCAHALCCCYSVKSTSACSGV